METDTAFVGANGVVVLDAVAHVGLNLAFVIHPSDAELIHAIWNAETLDEVHLIELWVLVVLFLDCTENFFYCLMILRFVWKATLKVFQYFFCVHCEMVLMLLVYKVVVFCFILPMEQAQSIP